METEMWDVTDFDYAIEDDPNRYGKEWWQDFMDRVIAYYESPRATAPEPIIVRSREEWKALGGPRIWPES